ncbi:DUF6443 domain-containing protein [Flavobacterium sp.]|uniref:DUF6443 domain-containing protein n=1 Tax=Flavobacterium sp. TaxID=239 RepID=UPI003750219E
MKKILYLLVFIPLLVLGQTTTENFTKVTTYKVETNTTIANPTIEQATQVVTYFDGLGRPIQTVASKQSSLGKNIVTPIEYDVYGRQVKEYLPYTTQTDGLEYEPNALHDILGYPEYLNQNPFSKKFLEASPLNRVLKQAAPGISWIGSETDNNDHTVKFNYQTNDSIEVKRFKVSADWDNTSQLYTTTFSDDGFYEKNQLYKTITKDENWIQGHNGNNTTQEFKDKEGKVILKRTFNSDEAHETYYLYDKYGNLTYVFPPKVDITNVNDQALNNLCYQYRYDARNRLVEKKLPGKQWEFIVYDKLDRVIATGPSIPPSGPAGFNTGWLITKYDAFSRVIYTAYLENGSSRIDMQTNANNATILNETKTTNTQSVNTIYTNSAFPTITHGLFVLLTQNYYDDYVFPNAQTAPSSVFTAPITTYTKGLATGSYVNVLIEIEIQYGETTTVYYDKKFRPIHTYTANYLGGFTQTQSRLNFQGQVLETLTLHKRATNGMPIHVTERFEYANNGQLVNHFHKVNDGIWELLSHNEYDELGKLVTKRVGGTDITTFTGIQKVDYTYNIRGWLTGINDMLSLAQPSAPTDLFAFKINYDEVQYTSGDEVKPLYNGNISETFWRTSSDNMIRTYGYKYDNLNRLLNAYFLKPNYGVTSSYDEYLTYDKNGNIMTLYRNGSFETSQDVNINIDNLTYTYEDQSNKLTTVFDATNNPNGFKDDVTTGNDDPTTDYVYDDNGNMIYDENKHISEIFYNHLNLPTQINFGGLGTITYLYDATGRKVKKVVNETQNNTTTVTDYLNGFQYKDNILQYFPTTEGYVNFVLDPVIADKGKYSYVYNYTDHLGNIRLSYAINPVNNLLTIVEENHYYPFGLKHSGYNSGKQIFEIVLEQLKLKPAPPYFRNGNNYKYQGQERQEELGLNWDSFKWRNYDPSLGRFMSVDPLSEKYSKWTPYAFAGNQVIHSRELEGLEPENDLSGDERQNYDSENHAPGFGGVMTDREHYQDAAPMGGLLENVFIGGLDDFSRADESNGYDNGRYSEQEDFDNDNDGYNKDDRINNEKALEEVASNFQEIGTFISLVGVGLSLTVVGAPVGTLLMAVGGGLSWGGIAIEFTEDAFDGHDGMDWGNHIMNIGSELIPGYYDEYFGNGTDEIVKGFDNLAIELGAAGSDWWMDKMSELHKN